MFSTIDLRLLKAYIVFVETGSVSETSRRIGRTQPAVSLQLRRLEAATNAQLFTSVGRKLVLTNDGELLLGYARTIMGLHDEVRARLAAPKIDGRVILGTPDLYAAYLLPPILYQFRKAYPNVDVEVRCTLSSKLMGLIARDEIDLALVTGMPAFKGGEVVGQERLVWITSDTRSPHNENPVPLAMLPPGNIFRDYALAGLEKARRTWRVVCVSESIGGLHAAVIAGVAVGVVGASCIVPGARQLARSENFPTLPVVDLVLYRAGSRPNPAAEAMAGVITSHFGHRNLSATIAFGRTQAGSGSHD